MRFILGGNGLPVYWYRCADTAKVFPYANAFVSRNWDTDEEWGDIGEVRPGVRTWRNGSRPTRGVGLHGPCDFIDWWVDGQPSPIVPMRPCGVDGIPACCNPDTAATAGNGQMNERVLRGRNLFGGGVGNGQAKVVSLLAVALQNRSSVDQAVVPAGLVTLTFPTNDYGFGGITTADNKTFVVPLHGLYIISVGGTWNIVVGAPQFRLLELRVRKNAVDVPGNSCGVRAFTPAVASPVGFSQVLELQAGDGISVIAINNEPGGASTWKVNPSFVDIALGAQLP